MNERETIGRSPVSESYPNGHLDQCEPGENVQFRQQMTTVTGKSNKREEGDLGTKEAGSHDDGGACTENDWGKRSGNRKAFESENPMRAFRTEDGSVRPQREKGRRGNDLEYSVMQEKRRQAEKGSLQENLEEVDNSPGFRKKKGGQHLRGEGE